MCAQFMREIKNTTKICYHIEIALMKGSRYIINNFVMNHIHRQWLEEDFIQYFCDWKTFVNQRKDIKVTKAQAARMMLSHETVTGLQITGYYTSYTA